METLQARTKERKGSLRNAIVAIIQENRREGCSVNEIMEELAKDRRVDQTFNRPIIELLVNELVSDGQVERKSSLVRWNHTRGLCGTPDLPPNTPLEIAIQSPPHCMCCGNKMRVVPAESVSMQQLGIYRVVCDFCSSSHT